MQITGKIKLFITRLNFFLFTFFQQFQPMFLFTFRCSWLFMNKSGLMMFMFLIRNLVINLILKLFTNVRVKKRNFLPLNIFSLNNFTKTRIFTLTTCTEAFLLNFRLECGMLLSLFLLRL